MLFSLKLLFQKFAPVKLYTGHPAKNYELNMKKTVVNPIFKDTCTFLQTSAEANGAFSEMEVTLGPNGGNPLHRHAGFAETFLPIEGNLVSLSMG